MKTTLLVISALFGANALKIDDPNACTPQAIGDINQNKFAFDATQQQQDILEWHNKARTDPKSLIPTLKQMLTYFGTGSQAKLYSVPGKMRIMTNEGAPAVQELIDFLETAEVQPKMEWDQLLAAAAKDLAVAQGKTSETGHTGPKGSTMQTRIEKVGDWQRTIGENIAYGTVGGQEIVLQLMIDDGVASRGHRTNILKAAFTSLGTWSSEHQQYRNETVLDYAGGMTSNGSVKLVKNYNCGSSTTPATAAPTTATGGSSTPATATPATGSNTDNNTPSTGSDTDSTTNTTSTSSTPPTKKDQVMAEAAKFFEECDMNKDQRLQRKEFRYCMKKIKYDIKMPVIKEVQSTLTQMRWDVKHAKTVGKTIWKGAKKFGKTNGKKGVTLEDVQGYMEANWDEVSKLVFQEAPVAKEY